MTLDELETELEECGANLHILRGFHVVVVWLYANDDPEIFCEASGPSLNVCVAKVLAQWNAPRGGAPQAS